MVTLKYFICGILVLNLGALVDASEGDEIMIDNFESNSEVRWEYFSDQVMGGVSEGTASFGSDNGEAYVQMTGEVSTANNGGFIQLRTKLASGADKNAQGIYIKVRGNGQKYYIHLRTRGTMLPWQYYQAGLDVTDDWKIIRLPLENFKPSGSWLKKAAVPTSIRSIGVVAYGRNHQADIQISEIGFY